MKIEDLSKIYDPSVLEKEEKRKQRIADSKFKAAKRTLRQKLMDTETSEDAVAVAIQALEDESPEQVLTAVVEVLGDVVVDLSDEVADSRKVILGLKRSIKPKLKKADAVQKIKLKSRIRDTESTVEAQEIAVAALEEIDPESVVETVIEVLADVIDDLEEELTEE